MTLEFWFMFPVGIAIATIAMASGVGGATFFSPLFLLVLGLRPEVAIGTALITEVFGFASGLYAYAGQKLIDYRLGLVLLLVTVPLAIVGTWLAGAADPNILKVILGVGLFAVAASFLHKPDEQETEKLDNDIAEEFPRPRARTCLVSADGEEICYTVCNKVEGMLISGIGGMFVGLISTGLGVLNDYFLLRRCKVPSRVSVATSVFVVAVTVLVASAGHLVQFVQAGPATYLRVASVVVFTVPAVILGGQIGPRVASRIPHRTMELVLAFLFIAIAFVTVGEVVLGNR